MEADILKLIYDYSINDELVDVKYIYQLISLVISKRQLGNYVKKVRMINKFIKDDESLTCAQYDQYNSEIIIYYANMQVAAETLSEYYHLFNDLEKTMFKNLVITQYILHELEHALQYKQIMTSKNETLEIKLIRPSFTLGSAANNKSLIELFKKNNISLESYENYLKENEMLYKKYYEFDPIERLAQVNSYKTLSNSLKAIKDTVPNLYEFNKAVILEEMLKGYQESWKQATCPTELYLYGTGNKNIWKSLDFYDRNSDKLIENVKEKYDLSKRLTLGLPITLSEYANKSKALRKTNKYNN